VFFDSVGIILKKNSLSPHKIVILDKIQGKIECVATTSSLSAGALITYTVKQQQSTYFITDSTLVYIPLSLAQTDMLFFHHVLELIYYFTHVGNCSKETFNLLAFLYATDHACMNIQYKKLFLLHLLMSMGNIPELAEIHTESIIQLSKINIKKANTITITHEKELDRWLWCCIWQHPYVNEFKTVHFLSENRTL